MGFTWSGSQIALYLEIHTTYELEKYINSKYSEPYGVHHYETLEIKSGYKEGDLDVIALEKGNIVDIGSRGPHPRLEQEAARVIKLLPQMTPGMQRGKAVGVLYSLPIVFQVQD